MADIEQNNDDSKTIKSFAGIPEAEFVQDVDKYMARSDVNGQAAVVLKRLDEQLSKYKFMECNLLNKKRRLINQIPDFDKSLEMIASLKNYNSKSEKMESNFLLNSQVYLKALIPPTDKVCLWLGANVMLEYNVDDAAELLKNNIEKAKKSLSQVEFDLDFLRDQITITEVNTARVYNWNVKRRHEINKKT